MKRRGASAAASPYSKEFGATWAVMELTGDVLEGLRRHFGGDAERLYVTAVLRCARHCALRYTEHLYDVSYASERFPGLDLSSTGLSNFMTGLGYRRRDMVAFMREFVPRKDAYVLFDGTALACASKNVREAQPGYNSHGGRDPQINLMYAAAIRGQRLMEVYLWDVRATNVGDGWRLEPIPKRSRCAIEALGLKAPDTLPEPAAETAKAAKSMA